MKVNFRLTGEGQTKLTKVLQRTRVIVAKEFKEGCEAFVKTAVANRAPSPEDEARILSQGTITDGGSYPVKSGIVGASPDEYHFRKEARQISLKDAIRREPINPLWQEGKLKVYLGNTQLYNPGENAEFSIGFSWTGGGNTRSTDDAEAGNTWRFLLESWEYGGVI
jgi:hypothetical protein